MNEGTDKVFFTRAPRIYYEMDFAPIELDPPPEKHIEEKQSVISTIGPAFTMAIPMILGFSVSKLSRGQTGYASGAFLYTGLITAVASAMMGVIWALTNLNNRKKQSILTETRRRQTYLRYVKKSEKIIRDRYNRNAGNLRLTYPAYTEYIHSGSVNENIALNVFSAYEGRKNLRYDKFLLWNRTKSDEDFLKVRIGTGSIPYDVSVSIPKERFSVTEDELKKLPSILKNKYSLLREVPITVDIVGNAITGVISEDNTELENLFVLLMMMIAVSFAPDEVGITCDFYSETIGKNTLRKVRFLPHITRKQSANVIIFTDDYESASEAYNGLELKLEKTGKALKSSVYYIVFAKEYEALPSDIGMVIQKDNNFCGLFSHAKGNSIRREVHFDKIDISCVEATSRLLQSIKYIEEAAEYSLPDMVSFNFLFSKEIEAIDVINWWGVSTTESEIKAAIGVNENGEILELDLHEKSAGPHGLIAGMTGSGKSEILQTIILSLAVKYSPCEVGFFLIDYKGGGMSNLFNRLPHLMGSISNLSGRMISRAMASVRSENERRQREFLNFGVNNISEYQALYKEGRINIPMPHVFIIIDEFAELKREEPEFMKQLISVARVGRSLGIHLVLATQKPTGAVDDDILSNSRFRICLRVQDRMDSMEMLKSPDAAMIRNPGRAYLQVGNNEIYTQFQGAYTMDRTLSVNGEHRLKVFDDQGKEVPRRKAAKVEADKPQIERVLDRITEAYNLAKPIVPPALWLEPLKEEIIYDEKFITKGESAYDIFIGEYDDPCHQRQGKVLINFINTGHHVVLGALQSGKSTLLTIISYALLKNVPIDMINMYFIDYSQGMLRPFKDSRACGIYINEDNEEDIVKLFVLLEDIISERKEGLRGGNFRQYIKSHKMPMILLVIDGFSAFRERTGGEFDKDILSILKSGEALGIYIIASALGISQNEMPARMFEHIKTCLPLSLKDKYEYKEALRVQGEDIIMPERVQGRGLISTEGGICEFQTCLPAGAENDFERAQKLTEEIEIINKVIEERYTEEEIHELVRYVPIIPKNPVIGDLVNITKKTTGEDRIPVAYEKRSGNIFFLKIKEGRKVIISGRPGSGKRSFKKVVETMAEKMGLLEQLETMDLVIIDDTLSFSELNIIKEESGADPYVIHLGGGIDRAPIGDFSYIPYTKQTLTYSPGMATVRKANEGEFYGEIIIPKI